jgi:hypothetical protein
MVYLHYRIVLKNEVNLRFTIRLILSEFGKLKDDESTLPCGFEAVLVRMQRKDCHDSTQWGAIYLDQLGAKAAATSSRCSVEMRWTTSTRSRNSRPISSRIRRRREYDVPAPPSSTCN